MVSQMFVVTEPLGLHLRPAGKLCELALEYTAKIQLRKGSHDANAKSVLGVLAAKVQQGDEIEIICEGVDEKEALACLMEGFQTNFGLNTTQE